MDSTARAKIIVVDDEPINIAILKQIIGNKYDVASASSGEQFFEITRNQVPNVILLDVILPGMTGFEVCEKIRKNNRLKDVKVILISGLGEVEERLKGYAAGANDYITKPFNSQELKAKVDSFVRVDLLERELEQVNLNLEAKVMEKTWELRIQYVTDTLTELPNRIRLQKDIERHPPGSLIILNIENFTSVNIVLGVEGGNEILKMVSKRLLDTIGSSGQVYRLSSDEFVILPETANSKDEILELTNNINTAFAVPFIYNELEIFISFCMGIAKDQSDNLLKEANLALIDSRSKGGGHVVFYANNHNIYDEYKENILWIKRVKEALKEDRIVPFFQPIRCNVTGETRKYECLVRMLEGKDIISPVFFLEPARKIGLMRKITERVIEKSFEHFSNTTLSFSINLTEEDLVHEDFIAMIKTLLQKYKISSENVIFEVLENFSIKENSIILVRLGELKALGCQIAIDDFGSERSNFARLLDMQVDYIKIDGAFIKDISNDHKSLNIAKAISNFAHSIGAKTVAEFVSSKEISDVVCRLGIDFSQGYFYGKPESSAKTVVK